ncbi:MAG: hypothetical protein HOW73_48990 [Polyangiaceae bacterium]|nr:hypothetical protein [Polyangiaceae bacterium]
MTPEELVTLVAEIAQREPIQSQELLCERVRAKGISAEAAERSTIFFQIACARAFLESVGVQPPMRYICFDVDGRIVEGGLTEDEPHYAAALQVVRSAGSLGAFVPLALESAEVGAVNQALHGGSNPNDLALGPTAVFLEPPTNQGLATAQQVILEMSPRARKRSWWKFW